MKHLSDKQNQCQEEVLKAMLNIVTFNKFIFFAENNLESLEEIQKSKIPIPELSSKSGEIYERVIGYIQSAKNALEKLSPYIEIDSINSYLNKAIAQMKQGDYSEAQESVGFAQLELENKIFKTVYS